MTGPAGSRGIALVVVMWATALLVLIAGSVAMTQRTETTLASGYIERHKALWLARAGLRYGIFHLLTAQGEGGWVPDGRYYRWEFRGHAIEVGLLDGNARIDLNAADEALLRGAIRAAGVTERQHDTLLDRILDWKDGDTERRPLGAEDGDYRAAGLPEGAGDRPFSSPGELHSVLGVTGEQVRALRPLFTVFSARRAVNPLYAPVKVLEALPGMNAKRAEVYAEQRARAHGGGKLPMPEAVDERYLTRKTGPVYEVSARVPMAAGGAAVVLTATVLIGGDDPRGYQVLEVAEGAPAGT